MASVIQTLGTPRRREILRLVWEGERSAGEIHRALGDVTFGAVSQHLRRLEDASLLRIRYPNGVLASGDVVEVAPPERIVFTYGYEDPAKRMRPGGSRVVVTLQERKDGTLLHLRHELPDAAARDHHVQGWRYQLAVF